MRFLFDWLDHRTGWRGAVRGALYESVPGGARWRYVWGSTLTFGLLVQFITGIFLWMAYSPGSQTAWESVYYIQDQMRGGWFLRGLHHYTAQVMTVLLILHLMQVVIDGAYKAPREINFWFGLILLQLVLALSLTGYLLPWDQKGFWASKVAINLAGLVPFVGSGIQRIIIGGPEYGHHTLTRFFALHAGVLPVTVTALVAGHVYLFRRHGLTAKLPKRRPDALFWPDQVLKDAVACLAVLAVVVFLIVRNRIFGTAGPLGAELGPPADPSEPYSAARPEWYFLCFFQFLKFFRGNNEVWGAIIIPGLIMLALFLMPWLGRWRLGHRFNIAFLFIVLGGAAILTWQAKVEDRQNAPYQAAVKQADTQASRVRALAASPAGIPSSGAVTLLRNDPLTQGPRLFAQKCASCHRYDGHNGLGASVKEPQTAADLKGFASREWIAGLLNPEKIATTNYFGGTHFASGKMVKFVTRDVAAYTPEQREQLGKAVIALSAEAQLKSQLASDQRDAAIIAQGRELIGGSMRCTDCHAFHQANEDAAGPDLTNYGSRNWLIKFINNPAHPDLYGKRNDRMPAFGADQILNEQAIGLIADWLRGSWYEPVEAAKK
jgi:ubiquinol-cytochrome c reductase cytochrome b subunit